MDNFIVNLNLSSINTNETSYMIGEIFGYYIIPITALIGSLLGVIYMVVLYNSTLTKLTKYKLLFYKVSNLVIFNIIFVGSKNNSCSVCQQIVYSSYVNQFFRLYVSNNLLVAIGGAAFCLEMLISYDRFCILKKQANTIRKDHIKYVYLSSLLLGAIMLAPYYCAYEIDLSASFGLYYVNKSWFGHTSFFFWYELINALVIQILTVSLIILLNMRNIIEYKRFIRNKSKLTNEFKIKAEAVFTKMIIIGTSVFIFTTVYCTVTYVIIKINSLNGVQYSSLENLNLLLAYELLLINFILDLLSI